MIVLSNTPYSNVATRIGTAFKKILRAYLNAFRPAISRNTYTIRPRSTSTNAHFIILFCVSVNFFILNLLLRIFYLLLPNFHICSILKKSFCSIFILQIFIYSYNIPYPHAHRQHKRLFVIKAFASKLLCHLRLCRGAIYHDKNLC